MLTKGEIALIEQILLLPQWYQKSSAEDASESICMWEKVNGYLTYVTNKMTNVLHKKVLSYQMTTSLILKGWNIEFNPFL